jgi:hypothetical protein
LGRGKSVAFFALRRLHIRPPPRSSEIRAFP